MSKNCSAARDAETAAMYSTVVGIDLGTTNSCVGTWKVTNGKGNVEILSGKEGKKLIPSCVSFMPNGTELIGDSAMHQRLNNRENTVFDIKRLIGRPYTDPFVQKMLKEWPFKVVQDRESGCPMVEIVQQGKTQLVSPTELQAKILHKMRETAELRLGHPVRKAVITIPAYFGQGPRQETRKAAELAGFELVHLLHEPTAAALFYGFDQQRFHGYNLLVFDLGGGTFDCTVLQVRDSEFQTLAIDGIENLGGRDFDQALKELVQEKIWAEHRRSAKGHPKMQLKLLIKCQKMKVHLTLNDDAGFDLDEFFDDLEEGAQIRVTQAEFNAKCRQLAEKCMDKVRAVLKSAEMRAGQIDEILLVGGSSRLPMLQEMLKAEFVGKKLNFSVNADEAVANGATLYAAQKCGKVKHSLPGGMNIREATPLSIGCVAINGGEFVKIIARNSSIPIKETQPYCCSHLISASDFFYKIYEGERLVGKENNFLGELKLTNCTPNSKGEVRTELSLQLDADGILHATALELRTKRRSEMRVDYSQCSVATKRGSNAVETMLVDAELNRERDRQELWRIEAVQAFLDEIKRVKYNLYQHKKTSSPVAVSDAEQRIRMHQLEQCKRFEDWFYANEKTASRQTFMNKLDEFQLACSSTPPASTSKDRNDFALLLRVLAEDSDEKEEFAADSPSEADEEVDQRAPKKKRRRKNV